MGSKHNQIYKLCQSLGEVNKFKSSSLHKQIFIFDLPAAGLESGHIYALHSGLQIWHCLRMEWLQHKTKHSFLFCILFFYFLFILFYFTPISIEPKNKV
jgi:hypothetical protein